MSTEVPEAAVEEVSGALARNFANFSSPQWIEIAGGQARSGADQAAAQLALGETVEWMTPGIVHRHGKVWPGAILLVTPHRLIVSASRGAIRAKREVSSLYRGPESLIGVSPRQLPGTSDEYWMLEIATQQGPFLFAIPNFPGSDVLAQITATFISRRAQFTQESGILVDGAPWGTVAPTAQAAPPEGGDPFEAAKADLAAPVEDGGPATEAFVWSAAAEPAPENLWSPAEEPAPMYTPPEPEPAPVYTPPEPEPEPEHEPVAALPAADWYADPLGEAALRYWDGQAWTQHTAN